MIGRALAALDKKMLSSAVRPIIQRCPTGSCRKDDLLQYKTINPAPLTHGTPPVVHTVLQSCGQPLDATTRTFFEPRFGQDYSAVRVHVDEKTSRAAIAVGAFAYTVGTDIVFGSSQYALGTATDK